MQTSPARENILNRIRQALVTPVPLPFPGSTGDDNIFPDPQTNNALLFEEEFSKIQGKFFSCSDHNDLREQLQMLIKDRQWQKLFYKEEWINELMQGNVVHTDLESCDVSITGCECLVARTGTIVLSSAQQSGRTTSVYAPIHICIAYSNQLSYDLKDALLFLQDKYRDNIPSFISFASGPSRTADIEKTLVTGVHGPKEVYCFLVGTTNKPI